MVVDGWMDGWIVSSTSSREMVFIDFLSITETLQHNLRNNPPSGYHFRWDIRTSTVLWLVFHQLLLIVVSSVVAIIGMTTAIFRLIYGEQGMNNSLSFFQIRITTWCICILEKNPTFFGRTNAKESSLGNEYFNS